MAFQLIELMPREQWNKKEKYAYLARWSADELLGGALREMVDSDFPKINNLPWERPQRIPGSKEIEHIRTDDLDLAVYTPQSVYQETLICTLTQCYNNHHPIALSPDLIYGHLVKGIAKHVDKYPEELRHLFVEHKGKKTLIYSNDSYVRGKKENDWALAFKSFADQMKDVTKDNALVQNDLHFSTSTPVSESHRHVLSMESMTHYFKYYSNTLCGMSAVILEGTEEDWHLLKEIVTKQLTEINDYCEKNPEAKYATLKWWSPHVFDMLQKIYDSYVMQKAGKLSADLKTWWSTIYKWNAGYGSGAVSTASGWVNILYPYLANGIRNEWVFDQKSNIKPADYPSYNSSVPFVWDYHGTEFKMRAIIGHSIPAQVSTSSGGAPYPQGTMKIFPAWAIVYE